jgi:hypothetical protein
MGDKVIAPWTDAQVVALATYQRSGTAHPYTDNNGIELIATVDGWVSVTDPDFIQTWAWKEHAGG